MGMTDFLFTSESVTEGHPDKVADQISDAILDAIIAEDPKGRVACETLVTTGLAMIAGEITTSCYVHMPDIVRETIKEIGYNDSSMGFDWETCAVVTSIDRQSPDIAMGVDEQGRPRAGGRRSGTDVRVCLQRDPGDDAHAHSLCPPADAPGWRRCGRRISWIFSVRTGRSQVTIQYINGKAIRVDAVVLAAQHTPEVKYSTLREGLIEEVIKKVIPAEYHG